MERPVLPSTKSPWFRYPEDLDPVLRDVRDNLDVLDSDVDDIQTGALPIPLAGIEGALGQYEPLANVATTVRSRAYNWEAEIKAKLVDDEWSTVESKRAELEAMDAARGTLCYRNEKGDKHFCTMPRCDVQDEVGDWYTGRILNREEKYAEGVTE